MQSPKRTSMRDTSTVTRQYGVNRTMSLRYKITDLSQHPQSQIIFIKVLLINEILVLEFNACV